MPIVKEPFKLEMVITVDYSKLNTFIANHYKLSKFEGHLESPNDMSHEYYVKAEELEQYDKEHLAKILNDKSCEHWSLGIVLNDLAYQGVIAPGNYIVSVSW